jgi:hypothetical protein
MKKWASLLGSFGPSVSCPYIVYMASPHPSGCMGVDTSTVAPAVTPVSLFFLVFGIVTELVFLEGLVIQKYLHRRAGIFATLH